MLPVDCVVPRFSGLLMSLVTFQVLEGLERGDVYRDLPTPVTIGREEDNHLRLNDERVSRFHAKIQEDGGKIILTDLESTNGTRVNGHPVKMRVLQIGDQVLIGRCLLLYGSPDEISAQVKNRPTLSGVSEGGQTVAADSNLGALPARRDDDADADDPLEDPFPNGPPPLPAELGALQAAQLSDVLAYSHSRIMQVLLQAQERITQRNDDGEDAMLVPMDVWRELQQLQMQLAVYIRNVADPPPEEE
ncbi:MAG: FHA domain-containing protein [Planctomycetota bacterium]|nr:MAG: FHA domain-containing protein [Planctomycetota bacterium]REK36725.1 MAG: FHA domain-containing protein [Planctomycetota bacterium]